MRISDWSSDVCSSDLLGASGAVSASFEGLLTVSGGSDLTAGIVQVNGTTQTVKLSDALAASAVDGTAFGIVLGGGAVVATVLQIGGAWGREGVCQYVEISVVAVS